MNTIKLMDEVIGPGSMVNVFPHNECEVLEVGERGLLKVRLPHTVQRPGYQANEAYACPHGHGYAVNGYVVPPREEDNNNDG